MFFKIDSDKLEKILSERDPRAYISDLNNYRNLGNPLLAVRRMEGYLSEDGDLILFSWLFFDGCGMYLEVKNDDNMAAAYDLFREWSHDAKEYRFSTNSPDLFLNPCFSSLFGKYEYTRSEQYGMFGDVDIKEPDSHIRVIGIDDAAAVGAFDEEEKEYTADLKNLFEFTVRQPDPNSKTYAYFDDDGSIAGYLGTNTFDDRYWDIANIYVRRERRGRGIATAMAKHFAHDVISRGKFASYGTAVNESSKHVATASGFELFELRYGTTWLEKK